MRALKRLNLVILFVSIFVAAPVAHASTGGTIIKAISRYIGRETGQEATEQAVKQMTKQVGEELIERTAQRIVREGGEKSLVEFGELVAKHGPDVVRPLDNVPEAIPVLKLLDELPAEDIAKAVSRLAAGTTGKELASLSTKIGTTALRAEARHPGVGLMFVRSLGKDGAELSLKLSSEQAVQIGKHVDDIAKLPASQQSQVLTLISSNVDRFATFVGRFVDKNAGKVLFTAASVPIILNNKDAIFGDGEIEFGPDGKPIFHPNGKPVRHQPGLLPGTATGVGGIIKAPVQTTLYWAGGVVVALLSLFGGSKVWKHFCKDRLAVEASKNAATVHATQSIPTQRVGERPIPDSNDLGLPRSQVGLGKKHGTD